jgi:hypothetical protein
VNPIAIMLLLAVALEGFGALALVNGFLQSRLVARE